MIISLAQLGSLQPVTKIIIQSLSRNKYQAFAEVYGVELKIASCSGQLLEGESQNELLNEFRHLKVKQFITR